MKADLPPDELELRIGGTIGILAPCPFCGRHPVMGSSVNDSPKYGTEPIYQARIGCIGCGVQMFSNTNDRKESQKDVAEKWNRRVVPST